MVNRLVEEVRECGFCEKTYVNVFEVVIMNGPEMKDRRFCSMMGSIDVFENGCISEQVRGKRLTILQFE